MRRVILNFHGLGTPARRLEEGEARYWVDPAFFEETLARADALKASVETHITFDDGNLSDLEIAAPLLARHGMSAQIFVLADRIGLPGSLGQDDIRQLQTAGHRIGSHGAAHVDWTTLDAAGQTREFDMARKVLEEITGAPVTAAAIPFGRYNAAVLRALRTRGYTHVYSSDGGDWRTDHAPIPRTSPRADMTLADIDAVLHGKMPLARQLRRGLARAVKRRL